MMHHLSTYEWHMSGNGFGRFSNFYRSGSSCIAIQSTLPSMANFQQDQSTKSEYDPLNFWPKAQLNRSRIEHITRERPESLGNTVGPG